MSTGKVLLGVLAGLSAGAVLGILFAPDKGTETRRKISKKSSDFRNGIKDKFNEFVDNVSDKFESVKEEAEDFTEKSKAKFKEAKNA